jgi:NhaP-type Na+/H+ or K+/H+ antiporter
MIAGAAVAALFVTFQTIVPLMFVFALWAGAVESVYSIANAHANDRTDPEDFVPLASTLLVAWSASATVVPLAVTALAPVFGPQTFVYAVIAVAFAYAGFVAHRLTRRETVPLEARENFELRSAQVPNAGALVEGEPPRE